MRVVGNRDGRLENLDAAEHLRDAKQRAAGRHASKARCSLALRDSKEELERACARHDRNVLAGEHLALGLAEGRAAIDPEHAVGRHRKAAEIVERVDGESIREHAAGPRVVAPDRANRKAGIREYAQRAVETRCLNPCRERSRFKAQRHRFLQDPGPLYPRGPNRSRYSERRSSAAVMVSSFLQKAKRARVFAFDLL